MIPDQWRMLITSLPGRSGTPRMRVWRALKARGAEILRDGVYLLPATRECERALEDQAAHVREAGGSAYVIDFTSNGDAQSEHFRALFDRSADYHRWTGQVAALIDRLPELNEPESRRRQARLRRELEAIFATDYFAESERDRATATLQDLESIINARFSPEEPTAVEGTVPERSPAEFQARRWATRRNLWVDRVACAWLIRRFIDTEAQFLWLARPADCPDDAVGFDFDAATFTHVGNRVSFEVLLHSFGLQNDRALAKLGALVHYLDVGGVPVPEAAGFVAMLAGAKEAHPGDDALLDAAGALLDHLYAAYASEDNK
jgi:hypothetical protein